MNHLLRVLFTALLLYPATVWAQSPVALPGLDRAMVDAEVRTAIGERIWQNEAAGRADWLVHWLPGEDHLSLGIGHFIWYPEGVDGPFVESFPMMLAFLSARGVVLPAWLDPGTPSPWPDRASFLAASDDRRIAELRRLLERTVDHQIAFMAERLRLALGDILSAAPRGAGPTIRAQLERLFGDDPRRTPAALYALMDYVNFKGEGIAEEERYNGTGWGLMQVLLTMEGHPGPGIEAFADAAAEVLERRVDLAPPARRERERWLDGWHRRVASYPDFTVAGHRPLRQPATGGRTSPPDRRGPGVPSPAFAPPS